MRGRLASWDAEKAELRQSVAERDRWRAPTLSNPSGRGTVRNARDKARIAEERRAEELHRLSEERAIAGAGRFAARLLARISHAGTE